MAKTKTNIVRTKKVRAKNKHLPKKTNGRTSKAQKGDNPASEEVGIILLPVVSAEPITPPEPSWIHRMKVNFPNGVKHFMHVLNAHDLHTFEDACDDIHKDQTPFAMFFKSVGLSMETENTLEVLQLKLVQGFRKVEEELVQHGLK